MAGMIEGGTRRDPHGIRRYRPMAEINVTPFVDVMLVLLVVFMVTAPLLQVGVPVKLPQAGAAALPQDNRPLTLSIDATGRIFLEETEIPAAALGARLKAIAANRDPSRTVVYVRGDRRLAYGRVVQVMATVTAAGFAKVALVAERPREGGTPKGGDGE